MMRPSALQLQLQRRSFQRYYFSSLENCASFKSSEDKNDRISESEKKRRTHLRQSVSIGTPTLSGNVTTREYHVTARHERGPAIALSLGALAATAKAGQYAVRAYDEWKNAQAENSTQEEKVEEEAQKGQTKGKDEGSKQSKDQKSEGNSEGKRENVFEKFFNLGVGSKYYEGGFEEKMTRREAALILGVRESSTPKRIKEAHRKLLVLNHPDTGGSKLLSAKINEAKELLLKGRR